jgi:hypothetical protein
MGKLLKVRIPSYTLIVDVELWEQEYGPQVSVREDVKLYFDLDNNLPPHLEGIVINSWENK